MCVRVCDMVSIYTDTIITVYINKIDQYHID